MDSLDTHWAPAGGVQSYFWIALKYIELLLGVAEYTWKLVKNRAETPSTLILKLNRVLGFSYVDPGQK
jgi:hypothetical protein